MITNCSIHNIENQSRVIFEFNLQDKERKLFVTDRRLEEIA